MAKFADGEHGCNHAHNQDPAGLGRKKDLEDGQRSDCEADRNEENPENSYGHEDRGEYSGQAGAEYSEDVTHNNNKNGHEDLEECEGEDRGEDVSKVVCDGNDQHVVEDRGEDDSEEDSDDDDYEDHGTDSSEEESDEEFGSDYDEYLEIQDTYNSD